MKPPVSGISQLDESRCGAERGCNPQYLKGKRLISGDLRPSDTVDFNPHGRKQNSDAVCACAGVMPAAIRMHDIACGSPAQKLHTLGDHAGDSTSVRPSFAALLRRLAR